MENFKFTAIDKLQQEAENFTGKSQQSRLIFKPVCETLKSFCQQDEEFAQAIVQSDKTLSDCLESVTKDCKTVLSDIEAYNRAVQFYFPGAGIEMKMTIDLCASVRNNEAEDKHRPAGKVIDLSLSDLFSGI